jgi:hypothetical protein
MSRLNVECVEAEAWRANLVKSVQRRARASLAENSHIESLRTSDPDLYNEMLEVAQHEAFDSLDEKPTDWRTLEELSVSRPIDLADDDRFLEYISYDMNVLNALIQTWVQPGSAVRLGERGFVEWTRLVEAGLALRGKSIPAEVIVKHYKLGELNHVIQPARPFRRKAEAQASLAPDMIDRLPEINRLFYLKPMPDQVAAAQKVFAWSLTHAKLIVDTVRTFEQVNETIASSGACEFFQITGDCCQASKRASDRDAKSGVPKHLPPFHVSCAARLDCY